MTMTETGRHWSGITPHRFFSINFAQNPAD
jgi:hypothetical protein